MTDSAHLLSFEHPQGREVLDLARQLLLLGQTTAATFGTERKANGLAIALQAMLHASTEDGYSMTEQLAGLSSATGWVLTGERDPDTRAGILTALIQTIWDSARRGEAAEQSIDSAPAGEA